MGTHPIFESDFDCLTDGSKSEIGKMNEVGSRHNNIKYFKRCLSLLPGRYSSLDSQRLVISHFALGGLSLLDAIDEVDHREDIIDWIYSLQLPSGGFVGSDVQKSLSGTISQAHIASTFSAVHCLIILGDDLSRINVKMLLSWLKLLQNDDGSISGVINKIESADMRFSYCAAYLIWLFAGNHDQPINIEKFVQFIKHCQSPVDSAFGQVPEAEGHGANTYCALASLHLLDRIETISRDERQRIIRFCVNRQTQGIHGRPCKVDDSCYTFWTGAALKIVSSEDPYLSKEETLISNDDVIKFLHACSDPIVGGVSKFPGTPPDPTHSFLALAGIGVLSNDVHPVYMLKNSLVDNVLKIRTKLQIKNQTLNSKPLNLIPNPAGIVISVMFAIIVAFFLHSIN